MAQKKARLRKDGKPDGRSRNGRNPNSQRNLNGHRPQEQETGLEEQSIDFLMELSSFGAIDLSDPDAVRQRYVDYLALCKRYKTKPLISGFCRVMGVSRAELIDWSAGKRTALGDKLSPESASLIKNFLEDFEVSWEYAFQNNGYRNPVTGIFLAKNNFGYKDTSETIVSHKVTDSGPTKAQLEAKYMAALPEQAPPKEIKLDKVENVPDDESGSDSE